jgi:deoxyribose-phosphate aldolase
VAQPAWRCACLDLTSLNDSDTEADIARLCDARRAVFGPVAAVCVWPRLAAFARQQAAGAHLAWRRWPIFRMAAPIQRAVRDTQAIVQSRGAGGRCGAAVCALAGRRRSAAVQLLVAVRKACPGLTLKVILETGELQTARGSGAPRA